MEGGGGADGGTDTCDGGIGEGAIDLEDGEGGFTDGVVGVTDVVDIEAFSGEGGGNLGEDAWAVIVDEEEVIAGGVAVEAVEVVDTGDEEVSFFDGTADGGADEVLGVQAAGEIDGDGVCVCFGGVGLSVNVSDSAGGEEGDILGIGTGFEVLSEGGDDGGKEPGSEGLEGSVETGFEEVGLGVWAEEAAAEAGEEVCEAAERGVEIFGEVTIYDGGVDSLFVEVDQLTCGEEGGVSVGLDGTGAEVREHDIGDIGDRFWAGGVFGVDIVEEADMALCSSGTEGVFIEDTSAGAIDEDGAWFHEGEEGGIDHTFRLVIFGDMEGDVVGLGEEVTDGEEGNAEGVCFFLGEEGVAAEEFDIEPLQASSDEPADIAEADDADDFAGDFPPHKFFLFPLTGAAGEVSGDDVAGVGEEEGEDFFCDGV